MPQLPDRRPKQIRVELKGPFGCLVGAVILAVALAILVVAAVAGLVAMAVAAWFVAGLAALGIVAAILRRRR